MSRARTRGRERVIRGSLFKTRSRSGNRRRVAICARATRCRSLRKFERIIKYAIRSRNEDAFPIARSPRERRSGVSARGTGGNLRPSYVRPSASSARKRAPPRAIARRGSGKRVVRERWLSTARTARTRREDGSSPDSSDGFFKEHFAPAPSLARANIRARLEETLRSRNNYCAVASPAEAAVRARSDARGQADRRANDY